ncbi:hypothetical protein FKW31_06355 [Acetobacter sp. DmW_136]|nr:hypothetical protein FKW31_06355 [Acetobacter sp. DmW_136]
MYLECGHFNVKGRLKVAIPASFGGHCVAPLLLDWAEKYQNLNLDLRFSDTDHNFVAERYDLTIRRGSV